MTKTSFLRRSKTRPTNSRTRLANRFREVSMEHENRELKRRVEELEFLKQENEELKKKLKIMSAQRGSIVALLQRAERIIAKVVIDDAPGSL